MLLPHCQAPSRPASEDHPTSSRSLSSHHLFKIPSRISGLCAAYRRIVSCLSFYWATSNPLKSLPFHLIPDSVASDRKSTLSQLYSEISKLDSTVRKHRTTLILCHRLISLKNTFIKKIGSQEFESLIL